MRTSQHRILTSHVGSLPRPDDLLAANRAREAGEPTDEAGFQQQLSTAVAEVVRRQHELGIHAPNDGEYGKAMGQRVNYGAWRNYSFHRLGGLAPDPSGAIVLSNFADRRDRTRFAEFYADPDLGPRFGARAAAPICIGPMTYTGHAAVRADIANLKERRSPPPGSKRAS